MDKPLTPTTTARLQISYGAAFQTAGARTVDVRVFSVLGGTATTLARHSAPSGSTVAAPLTVDLTDCLAAAAPATVCTVFVDVRLLDSVNAVVDSVALGPFDAAPQSVIESTVSLRAVSTIALAGRDTVFAGDTAKLNATLRSSDGEVLPGRTVTWTTSDPLVATVSSTGLVTTLASGTVTISAARDGAIASRQLSVEGWSDQFVASGQNAVCGITTSGNAYCWGLNVWGERGNGAQSPTAAQTVPARVTGVPKLSKISTYAHHTCGLSTVGQVYCWGRNTWGQVGVAPQATTPCTAPDGGTNVATFCAFTPVLVSSPLTFTNIAVGSAATCAQATTGTLHCWGANESGQLGRGAPDAIAHPELQQVQGATLFADISASIGYFCGVSQAGQGLCWGADFSGATGTGSPTFPAVPTAVTGGHAFRTIDARGFFSTCGVTTGALTYCWGRNIEGQLGIGTQDALAHAAPLLVATPAPLQSVATGFPHTCGLATDGRAFCWGTGAFGELGTGNTSNSFAPAAVAGNLTFRTLTAGAFRTCGVALSRRAYCWGANGGGFGNGSTANALTPTVVGIPR